MFKLFKKNKISFIITSTSSLEEAERIADILLKRNLVACIQILDITSHYKWEGKQTKSEEKLLILKSRMGFYCEIEKVIIENHSYKIPEIIEIESKNFYNKYFSWLTSSCN